MRCQLSLFLIVLEAYVQNTTRVPLDFRLDNTLEFYFDSAKQQQQT